MGLLGVVGVGVGGVPGFEVPGEGVTRVAANREKEFNWTRTLL